MSGRKIKLVIWDLDNTIWNGILAEDSVVGLRENIPEIIKELDSRGILQSIASKNDYDSAFKKLIDFKLDQYFIYPKINWYPKSENIKETIKSINVGLDTVAFIDDENFELAEVSYAIPQILCLDATVTGILIQRPEFIPNFITDDSKLRRQMYQSDIKRNNVEASFIGPKEDFLKSLHMVLTIKTAEEIDLQRAEELTVRTHQLNSTGYTYSYDELKSVAHNDNYKLLISGLEDDFGTYGKIGVSLIECNEKCWTIKLLLTSCRVVSRGIGSILLNLISKAALGQGVDLFAEFVPTDRNRIMYITYKLSGFQEICTKDNLIMLKLDNKITPTIPDYLKINAMI